MSEQSEQKMSKKMEKMGGEIKELRGKLVGVHDMLTRISKRTDEFAKDFQATTNDFVDARNDFTDFKASTTKRFTEERKLVIRIREDATRRINELHREINRETTSRGDLAVDNHERFKALRVEINDLQNAVADIREALKVDASTLGSKDSADFDGVPDNVIASAMAETVRLKCIEIASHATSYKHPDDVLKDAAAYEHAVLYGFGSIAAESESEPSTDAPEKDVELCDDSGLCVLPKGHPGALHSTNPDKHTDAVNWGHAKKSESVCMAMRETGATSKMRVVCSRSRGHIGQHYDKRADLRWDK